MGGVGDRRALAGRNKSRIPKAASAHTGSRGLGIIHRRDAGSADKERRKLLWPNSKPREPVFLPHPYSSSSRTRKGSLGDPLRLGGESCQIPMLLRSITNCPR